MTRDGVQRRHEPRTTTSGASKSHITVCSCASCYVSKPLLFCLRAPHVDLRLLYFFIYLFSKTLHIKMICNRNLSDYWVRSVQLFLKSLVILFAWAAWAFNKNRRYLTQYWMFCAKAEHKLIILNCILKLI